jgi:hypothetical protein
MGPREKADLICTTPGVAFRAAILKLKLVKAGLTDANNGWVDFDNASFCFCSKDESASPEAATNALFWGRQLVKKTPEKKNNKICFCMIRLFDIAHLKGRCKKEAPQSFAGLKK